MVETFCPDNLNEALSLLRKTGGTVLAGGTDLMVRYRGPGTPAFERNLLYIGRLPELRYVREEGGAAHIGACTTYAELLASDIPPVLREAVGLIGSPAIRNAGTMGGNICNASPAGDSIPPLIALGATVRIMSLGKSRTLPLSDFITGPGTTVLRPDELLAGISLERGDFDIVFYKKVGTRAANALSKLSFTGLARTAGGILEKVRICFGGVAPVVVRSEELEKGLCGMDADTLEEAADEVGRGYEKLIEPIDDQRSTKLYRREVSLRLLDYFIRNVVVPGLKTKETPGR